MQLCSRSQEVVAKSLIFVAKLCECEHTDSDVHLGYFSVQLRNVLALLVTFPDGVSLPTKRVFFCFSFDFCVVVLFCFVLIKLVKSSLKSLESGFSFCCHGFLFW